ncbi:MAG: DUF1343 domain-containing protein [Chlorobiaceae bacterium]|nr:DUF1343 domain-containing protein [Chlorobiaceae bacterium]
MTTSLRIAAIILLLLFNFVRLDAAGFRYGIDMVASGSGPCTCKQLKGKRVGFITNAAALSVKGEPSWQVLVRRGVDLKFVMAPEHGFSLNGAAGEKVSDTVIADSIRVYSLYGATQKPDQLLLKKIDVLAFDLQDVGTRCYTYISTMKLAMEACDEAGITFLVFDRPNPIAPLPVGGFLLEPGQESFVGAARIPFVHGMTIGEIAWWLQRSRYPRLSLQVVRMRGYSHTKFADEFDGFRFVPPSPNIRNLETAVIYPATVMLEATAVSEGRGTPEPFATFGAPFVDSAALLAELGRFNLPGVEFSETDFIPTASKFAGRQCQGVRIRVTDRKRFDPFMTSTAILLSLQKRYPEEVGIARNAAFFDRLAGTPRYRVMILEQRPIEEILEAARAPVRAFESAWPDRLLYP